MGKIEVLCLGTGSTLTSTYGGPPATSYAILLDGYPVLLVGCGTGTVQTVSHLAHVVPECILLLSSSMDQTMELAGLIAGETAKGRKLRIFASESVCVDVAAILRPQLRCYDVPAEQLMMMAIPEAMGEADFFPVVHEFSVLLHGFSSEVRGTATSAVLCYKDQSLVSFTGPVPFDSLLYAKLCQAPFLVCWAQREACSNSACIEDIVLFAEKVNTSRKGSDERIVFLIGGYGSAQDAPMVAGYVSVLRPATPVVLIAGDFVQSMFGPLQLPLPNVKKAAPMRFQRNAVHQEPQSASTSDTITAPAIPIGVGAYLNTSIPPALRSCLRGAGELGITIEKSYTEAGPRDTRKIFVFNNEDKGLPGKLVLLHNFRNLLQLQTRVAEMLRLKPLHHLCFVNGEKVKSLEDIPDGAELIALRRAGIQYDPRDLPRLLKSVGSKR